MPDSLARHFKRCILQAVTQGEAAGVEQGLLENLKARGSYRGYEEVREKLGQEGGGVERAEQAVDGVSELFVAVTILVNFL